MALSSPNVKLYHLQSPWTGFGALFGHRTGMRTGITLLPRFASAAAATPS